MRTDLIHGQFLLLNQQDARVLRGRLDVPRTRPLAPRPMQGDKIPIPRNEGPTMLGHIQQEVFVHDFQESSVLDVSGLKPELPQILGYARGKVLVDQ